MCFSSCSCIVVLTVWTIGRVLVLYAAFLCLSDWLMLLFSARCNIYISRLCYDVSVRLSVRLSVMEVHWRIIANLGFKFRSNFIAHCDRSACGRIVVAVNAGKRGGVISRYASHC